RHAHVAVQVGDHQECGVLRLRVAEHLRSRGVLVGGGITPFMLGPALLRLALLDTVLPRAVLPGATLLSAVPPGATLLSALPTGATLVRAVLCGLILTALRGVHRRGRPLRWRQRCGVCGVGLQ